MVSFDRFQEPIERRRSPEVDEIDEYKRLRDMEQIDFKESEVNEDGYEGA